MYESANHPLADCHGNLLRLGAKQQQTGDPAPSCLYDTIADHRTNTTREECKQVRIRYVMKIYQKQQCLAADFTTQYCYDINIKAINMLSQHIILGEIQSSLIQCMQIERLYIGSI